MTAGRTPPAWWYDPARKPPLAARLLSSVYGGVVGARSALYARGWLKSHQAGVPVVIVGNLVAGGSGKTPLVIALVERLKAEGRKPGVATRGYGREQADKPLWVTPDTDPALAGDEPLLIARRTGARVRADRDRVAAAQALVAAGCDIVVCDDGLQHYRLARDVEIEVLDARRRHGNDRLLPAGPLREPISRAAKCDFHVVNLGTNPSTPVEPTHSVEPTHGRLATPRAMGEADHGSALQAGVGFGEWPMHLRPGAATPLQGGRPIPLDHYAGKRIHAVAGIGDPERFFEMLRALGIAVVPHAFPDHHRYTADDFDFGSDLPVLMTEKDAVKAAPFATARFHAVPVEAVLPEAFWVALLDKL